MSRHNRHMEEAEEEEEGELWLVSYADMVTLLFGFFVILYSFSTLDEKKFNAMADQMAEAFKTPKEHKLVEEGKGVNYEQRQVRALQLLIAMLNLGDDMDSALKKIESIAAKDSHAQAEDQVVRQILAHRLDFQGSSDAEDAITSTVELILPYNSLFATGSSQLTAAASNKLRQLAADLHMITDILDIEVVGHTDSMQAKNGSANNFVLSSVRAGAVAAELMRFGIPSDKLSVRGMGSLKPLVPERDGHGHWVPANMAKNRRVHLVIRRLGHAKINPR